MNHSRVWLSLRQRSGIRLMRFKDQLLLTAVMLLLALPVQAEGCRGDGVWLQVLGSGGPELDDGRASTAYLLWHNGQARILVDMGAGSALRFEQSGAAINDLDMILFSHLHVDHSNDLPALIKASYFSDRKRDLPIYGPTGNSLMPSMTAFVQGLFGAQGSYRYLSDYLHGSESYRLLPKDVEAGGKRVQQVNTQPYRLSAVPVRHGPIPSLAWRIEIAGRSIVFSGDMSNDNGVLAGLAQGADLLVAHHAIPEQASGAARRLHMPPSVIGDIAASAGARQLLLSHRMKRTYGEEAATEALIRKHYSRPLQFADDLQCYSLAGR